ncbi:hypothetical protein DLJ53_01695 [Acuticoccus sediminis]|uniref:DUF5666 domain-containing protein n=1 Tax=Acuticoccus sediminis TaxID=2184697 RepID=A0A8B2NWP2_9HYPH|nr:hypothetical protein [Acuticoccus sediminis]RAI03261.1 hypothetical protein DLJ53_01695 [Acuticoccus sediminis]
MSIRRPIVAATLALATLSGAAYAGDAVPNEAHSLDLGTVSGVAYYTVEPEGYRVVATLAENADGTPLRVTSVLAPGQSVTFSTPRAAGIDPVEVEITREADILRVRDTATLTN